MSYWDTSALVKLYVKEPDSAIFEQHLSQSRIVIGGGPPATAMIGVYEAAATFYRKESEGNLPVGSARTLHAELLQDIAAGEIRLIEIGTRLEIEYGQILNFCYQQTQPIFIRTLDALHLASARVANEQEIVATDKRIREAAGKLGFALFPA